MTGGAGGTGGGGGSGGGDCKSSRTSQEQPSAPTSVLGAGRGVQGHCPSPGGEVPPEFCGCRRVIGAPSRPSCSQNTGVAGVGARGQLGEPGGGQKGSGGGTCQGWGWHPRASRVEAARNEGHAAVGREGPGRPATKSGSDPHVSAKMHGPRLCPDQVREGHPHP